MLQPKISSFKNIGQQKVGSKSCNHFANLQTMCETNIRIWDCLNHNYFGNCHHKNTKSPELFHPGGYFQIRRSGRLGPHIKFGGKIWGKVQPSSQNKRKNLGSSVTKRRKSWEKVPILVSYLKFRGQNLGYLSFIFLEAKFGAPTRISEAKFWAKPPPPDLLIWKYPLSSFIRLALRLPKNVSARLLHEASGLPYVRERLITVGQNHLARMHANPFVEHTINSARTNIAWDKYKTPTSILKPPD